MGMNGNKAGRPPKYPWAKIRLGRSIIVPGAVLRTLGPAARQWASRHGRRFRLSTEGSGVKIRRVE